MKRLIFIEDKKNIKKALAHAGKSAQIIALTPVVGYDLERLGIAYAYPEAYHSEAEIVDLGMDNFNRLNRFCDHADRRLSACVDGLDLAFLQAYRFKILFDALRIRIFQVKRIIEAEKPDMVLYFSAVAKRDKGAFLFVDESIYSNVIPLVGRQKNIPVKVLGVIGRRRLAPRLMLKSAAGMSLATLRSFRSLLRKPAADLRADIMLLKGGYDISFIRDHLSGRLLQWSGRVQIDEAKVGKTASLLRKAYDALVNDAAFRALLNFEGVDVFPVIGRRLENYFCHEGLNVFRVFLQASELARYQRPKMMLTSMLSDARSKAVARAYKAAGKPVVVWYHGACGYSDNQILYYNDIAFCDHFLVGGQVAKRFFDRTYCQNGKFVPVGSAKLDRLVAARSGYGDAMAHQIKTVVYVLTGVMGNMRYISYRQFSDNEYFMLQRRLLDEFKRYPHLQFLIKLSPTRHSMTPLKEYIDDNQIRNCRLVRDGSFTDLLNKGDLFIFDWPMTAFLEVLAAGKPVIALDQGIPFYEEALTLARRRALMAHDVDGLIEHVARVLSQGKISVDLSDEAFLRMFGTHLNDGKSAGRAVGFLNGLVSKGEGHVVS